MDGNSEGTPEGAFVGFVLGLIETDGAFDGKLVSGAFDGKLVGIKLGSSDGISEEIDSLDGLLLGSKLGSIETD